MTRLAVLVMTGSLKQRTVVFSKSRAPAYYVPIQNSFRHYSMSINTDPLEYDTKVRSISKGYRARNLKVGGK